MSVFAYRGIGVFSAGGSNRAYRKRETRLRGLWGGKSTEVDFVYSLAANSFAVGGRVSGLLVVSVQSVR